jgi:GT2 family glycosyltransferase
VKLSIVIPCFNELATIDDIIDAVNAAPYSDKEIIIVDDCSTDETLDILSDFKNIKLIKNATNLGFLRSCNLGAAKARGKYIFLLNNDTQLTIGSVEELMNTFDRFDNVGIAGAKLLFENNKGMHFESFTFNDNRKEFKQRL